MEKWNDDWFKSVDERLVNLNSAQKSADVDLHRLKKQQERVDRILRGDPERNIKGQIEALNHLENEVMKFNRIFEKDYLGHGGLQSFITFVYNELRKREKAQELNTGYKWGFWGVILAAVIGAVALIITNKDQIEKWLPRNHPTSLDMKLDNVKHPKAHRRHIVINEDGDILSDTKGDGSGN